MYSTELEIKNKIDIFDFYIWVEKFLIYKF